MRKLLGLLVSLAILGLLYWRIDAARLLEALGGSDLALLGVGLLLFVPTTGLSAWRLSLLAPTPRTMGLGEASRLVLIASSLNMVLPSKLGDIAKAHAITRAGHLAGADALALVVLEKTWDLLALIGFCAVGLLLLPLEGEAWRWLGLAALAAGTAGLALVSRPEPVSWLAAAAGRLLPARRRSATSGFAAAWQRGLGLFWASRPRALALIALSLAIWLAHLVQIWVFALGLGGALPFLANLGATPLAIFAGLLPFTFAGVGTRDAALVVVLAPWLAAPTAAALGLLCTLRYLVPALAGLPFLGAYLGREREGGLSGSRHG